MGKYFFKMKDRRFILKMKKYLKIDVKFINFNQIIKINAIAYLLDKENLIDLVL